MQAKLISFHFSHENKKSESKKLSKFKSLRILFSNFAYLRVFSNMNSHFDVKIVFKKKKEREKGILLSIKR